eukprot:scaffold100031_cov72-Phaeocystis_antarctica.AAC.5
MMCVAAHFVKPSSALVRTKRPVNVRGAASASRGCANGCKLGRGRWGGLYATGGRRTAQDGAALLVEQRAVIHRDEARDALPPLVLVPVLDPSPNLTRPHTFAVCCLAGIGCGADAIDAYGGKPRVQVLAQVFVEPPV